MSVQKESQLVNKIKKYLNSLDNSYFFKIHGGPMQMVGISDLIGVYNGRFVAFEVKTPENKKGATELQKWFIHKIASCGGYGSVVRSLDEVKEKINIV